MSDITDRQYYWAGQAIKGFCYFMVIWCFAEVGYYTSVDEPLMVVIFLVLGLWNTQNLIKHSIYMNKEFG